MVTTHYLVMADATYKLEIRFTCCALLTLWKLQSTSLKSDVLCCAPLTICCLAHATGMCALFQLPQALLTPWGLQLTGRFSHGDRASLASWDMRSSSQ